MNTNSCFNNIEVRLVIDSEDNLYEIQNAIHTVATLTPNGEKGVFFM